MNVFNLEWRPFLVFKGRSLFFPMSLDNKCFAIKGTSITLMHRTLFLFTRTYSNHFQFTHLRPLGKFILFAYLLNFVCLYERGI